MRDSDSSPSLQSGHISLSSLYEFVCGTADAFEGLRTGDRYTPTSSIGRSFGSLRTELCASIPYVRGVYFWGQLQAGAWRTIYVGKTFEGRGSSLNKRISEELQNGRHILFRTTYLHEDVLEWEKPQYKKGAKLALLKEGTSHIVWVATPELSSEEVTNLECGLIAKLDPPANCQKRAYHSSVENDKILDNVLAEMDRQIQDSALMAFPLVLL